MKAKVSIITPVYNCEKYIARCIDSLLQQTHEDVEIIMVDDGSIDQSAKIIKEYVKITDKIRYIYQENSGPGVARNKAIKEATGKYIMFVDADDYISKDYVEAMVDSAKKNHSELVIAGYTFVYENGKRDKVVIPKYYERNNAEEWAYRISACCSRLYLREFWINSNLKFNEERNARAEDVPIVLYSNAMAKNISIVKNPGYYYYQHAGSAMNRKGRVIFEFPYIAFEEMYKKIRKEGIKNSREFFNIGILKFLAQFDLVIYRKAGKERRNNWHYYLNDLLKDEFITIRSDWRKLRAKIELPIIHKIAINIFVYRYKKK